MWRIHFKTAVRQFKANPLFAGINLFGIGITLTFLMVFITRYDYEMHPGPPEVYADEVLYFDYLYMHGPQKARWGRPSFSFLEKHVLPLKNEGQLAFYGQEKMEVHHGNAVRKYMLKYCNATYWQMMQFNFLEGQAFNKQHIQQRAHVVVLSRTLKTELLGKKQAVGKTVSLNGRQFRVTGVVEDVPVNCQTAFAHVWLPHTLDRGKGTAGFFGNYEAVLLPASHSSKATIHRRYQMRLKPTSYPTGFTQLQSKPYTQKEVAARSFGAREPLSIKFLKIALLILLVLLLPALSLINLNTARIRERFREIAVRKTFGARKREIIGQILAENLVLTGTAGLISLLFSSIIFSYAGNYLILSDPLLQASAPALTFSFRVFGILLLIVFVFTLLSGIIPAFRASKINVSHTLQKA